MDNRRFRMIMRPGHRDDDVHQDGGMYVALLCGNMGTDWRSERKMGVS